MKPVRRLVTIDDERGKSRAIADGPRPRCAPIRAPGRRLDLDLGHRPQPGANHDGLAERYAQLRAAAGRIRVPHRHIRAGWRSAAAHAQNLHARFLPGAEGEITLVLDLEEVRLGAGDVVVQRAASHAWSNRSARPCRVAISSHDGAEETLAHA